MNNLPTEILQLIISFIPSTKKLEKSIGGNGEYSLPHIEIGNRRIGRNIKQRRKQPSEPIPTSGSFYQLSDFHSYMNGIYSDFISLIKLRLVNKMFKELIEIDLVQFMQEYFIMTRIQVTSSEVSYLNTQPSVYSDDDDDDEINRSRRGSFSDRSSRSSSIGSSGSSSRWVPLSASLPISVDATSVYSNSPPNTNPSFFNTGSSSPSPISTNSPNQAVFPENRARIPLDYGNPDIIHCECCAYDSLHRVYEFVPFYPPTFNVYSYKNAEIGRGGRTVPPIDNGIVYPGELLFTRKIPSFRNARIEDYLEDSKTQYSAKRELLDSERRIFTLDLNDIPGLHYVGDFDCMIEYTLERIETQVVRWVEKVGASSKNLNDKIAINAHDISYKVTFRRVLVGFSFLLRMFVSRFEDPGWGRQKRGIEHLIEKGELERSQIFNEPMNHLNNVILSLQHSIQVKPVACAMLNEINVRHELILGFLAQYFLNSDPFDILGQEVRDFAILCIAFGGFTDRISLLKSEIQNVLVSSNHSSISSLSVTSPVLLRNTLSFVSDDSKIIAIKLCNPKILRFIHSKRSNLVHIDQNWVNSVNQLLTSSKITWGNPINSSTIDCIKKDVIKSWLICCKQTSRITMDMCPPTKDLLKNVRKLINSGGWPDTI